MITIPIGLDEEIVEKIDALVKKGIYENRIEALRAQIIQGLEKRSIIELRETPEDVKNRILTKLLQHDKPLNLLPTEKSVTELISEGR